MVIANYRRELYQMERKNLIDKYKKLRDERGGIFTSTMRRRLLGIKLSSNNQFREDSADFWYDVRTYVKNGLKDLELICEVAHPDQLDDILTGRFLSKEEQQELAKISDPNENHMFFERLPSLTGTLTALFKDYKRVKTIKSANSDLQYNEFVSVEKSDAWRAELANKIIKIGLNFYKEHNLITTKAHQRLVDELEDMLDVELGHAHVLPRDKRNLKFY